MPKAQIKDEKTYRKLRSHGQSKGKAARIANAGAATSPKKVAAKGGKSRSYDDWSKQDLLSRAKEVGIKGRSSMKKKQLVDALRHHKQPASAAEEFRDVATMLVEAGEFRVPGREGAEW